MAESPKARRRIRRILTVLAAVVGVLVALGAILVLTIDEREISERMKAWVLPRFEERLGRNLEVEQVRVEVFPTPRAVLENLEVSDTGEVPLLEVPRTEVELALWPLITSLGQEIRIQAVDLHQPELNLIRQAQGAWNVEGLGEQEEPAPSKREVVVERITTHGGTVRIIDRSGPHGEATVALSMIDATATNVGPGLPLTFRGSAAFASDEPNLQVDASLDRLPESVQGLASTEWPEVRGMLSLTDAQIPRLEAFLPARVGAMVTGGLLDVDAEVKTGPEGAVLVDGSALVDALRLRGEPATGSFDLAMRVTPEELTAPRIQVQNLQLKGPGLHVTGSAELEGKPARVQFALRGPLLDLETLLGVMPEAPEQAEVGAREGALPARLRQKIDAIQATGTIHFDRVTNGDLVATDVDARARLNKGKLVLEQAEADFYQGRVDAKGTTVNLVSPVPEWQLRARLDGVDLSQAMSGITGSAPLEGRVNASVSLDGKGAEWAAIAPTLTGQGALALQEGVLTSADVGDQLAQSLAQGLRAMGRTGEADVVTGLPGKTVLGQLATHFTVRNGWLEIGEPLAFNAPFGSARLDGRIGLTKQLDLRGRVALSRDFVANSLQGFGVQVRSPVEVPVSLGGTLEQPRVIVPEPQQIAQRLVRGEVDRRAQQLQREVERQARRRIPEEVRKFIPLPR